MKCPFCANAENKVIDSRISKDSKAIRRRRECLGCAKRFTTYEYVEDILPMVVKKDGRREQFDRQKILNGVKKACEKRPISMESIDKIVENVEQACQEFPGRRDLLHRCRRKGNERTQRRSMALRTCGLLRFIGNSAMSVNSCPN